MHLDWALGYKREFGWDQSWLIKNWFPFSPHSETNSERSLNVEAQSHWRIQDSKKPQHTSTVLNTVSNLRHEKVGSMVDQTVSIRGFARTKLPYSIAIYLYNQAWHSKSDVFHCIFFYTKTTCTFLHNNESRSHHRKTIKERARPRAQTRQTTEGCCWCWHWNHVNIWRDNQAGGRVLGRGSCWEIRKVVWKFWPVIITIYKADVPLKRPFIATERGKDFWQVAKGRGGDMDTSRLRPRKYFQNISILWLFRIGKFPENRW